MGAEIILRCLCGQLNEKCELRDPIPVRGSLCHCNICRRVTGALTFSGCALVGAPNGLFKEKLTKFATSEAIHRYFCQACGSHVCYYVVKENRWSACPGAIDQMSGDFEGALEQYTEHEFVGDTIDGGFAWLVPGIPIYLEDDQQDEIGSLGDAVRKMQKDNVESDTVKAECYCGQVSMIVRKAENDERYRGGICACRSCRLEFGQPLSTWALNVPFVQISWSDGTIYDGSAHKSITRYWSSDHAAWDSCSRCGASVFYQSTKRPGCTDIAVGLIRAPDGALARSLLKWDSEPIHFVEDAVDQRLFEVVASNIGKLKG